VLQAPHLSVLRRERSLFDLAADMLNHAPLMWANLPEAELRWPRLTPQDVASLAAYLNPTNRANPPANVSRGQRALYQKGCLTCHTVKGQGQKVARDLGGLTRLDSNEAWIAALWNHTPSMLAERGRRAMPYATFEGQELVDLIGFLREEGRIR
jgi:mono/diheme cytochrome c family protein